jgi:arylsulfatase B
MKLFKHCILLLLTASIFSCKKTEGITSATLTPTPFSSSPNIIFIIADDMGWDAFGSYTGITSTKAKTPTLDSLAKNGLSFTNFWTNPECSPTRAAMLTGKYGFRTSIGAPGDVLSSSETLIQKYINTKTSNAYATAVIGKWHVSGSSNLTAPEGFGVQYFSGFMPGAINDYYNWTETTSGAQKTVTTYATTQFVNESISWIKQQDKPFFLWLAFNAPHTPFHRPPLNLISNQSLSNNQATIDANPLPYYLASIEAMDQEIGRLIASLTAFQKENTVFVFIGDNGTPTQVAQTPFVSKAKSTLYQGGVNTPLIVSGKNVSRKNELETAMVQAPDMFTTFADIAGAGSANYQDGVSLKTLLTTTSTAKRNFTYSELFGSAISKNDGYALRNDNYKLIHLTNGTEYLFKVSTDPFELNNILSGTLSTEAQTNLTQLRQIKTGL